jgi:FkbM family methyltransferase
LIEAAVPKQQSFPRATSLFQVGAAELRRESDEQGVSANGVDKDDPKEVRSEGDQSSDDEEKPTVVRKAHVPNLHELLPEPILALAWRVFEKEEVIAQVVENSVLVNVSYAGVKMELRMNKDDDATSRLGEEALWFSYDLDTLGDLQENSSDMLNMLDLGGSYGVVTIAAMAKYATRLRIITVEPIPTTYFFLKWNLYLNGVPEIEKAVLDENKGLPGVYALNRGLADAEDQDVHFCFDPTSSMNSRACECQRGDPNCLIVPSVTTDNLTGLFGAEPIAMVKMDCEGCEAKSLPALASETVSKRVRRLAGELHLPDPNLEEIACRWDHGRLLSKCQQNELDEVACGMELNCPI